PPRPRGNNEPNADTDAAARNSRRFGVELLVRRHEVVGAARVAEDVLQAAPPGARFSVRSLQAWRVLSPLHREVVVRLGAEAPASQALRRALRHLTLGAHRFFREDKANAYRAARDDVSESVFHLLIEDVPDADPWLDRLENDAMAALTGLLRRYDQRRPG
ncbi:MAG TPA: hypothetical protein PKA64_15860, partial [Myxococcota bacterium]|nr:hypothetical protein [Myxococcota bacterium]